MAENPLAIANTFIDIAAERDQKVTPLKLLKLIYFAHGWHLALTGKPLLNEAVEAWKFGPVVPSIYRAFKNYKDKPIDGKESQLDMEDSGFNFITPVIEKNDPKNMRAFLEKVWDVYGKLGAGQLSRLTHQQDSPWYEVWEKRGGKNRKGTDIPDDLIKDFFEKKLPTEASANQI